MGLSILTNKENTEAVIINDSVLPPHPLDFVFTSYDGKASEIVNEFIEWLKPRDARHFEDRLEILWKVFIKQTSEPDPDLCEICGEAEKDNGMEICAVCNRNESDN